MASVPETPQTPPDLVPEVGSCYRYAWSRLWKYFLELLLIFIISVALGVPGGIGSWVPALNFLTWIYNILIGGPVEFGVSYANLKAVRDTKPEAQDIFEAFKTYWNSVLASLLTTIIVGIGFVLLIVPGVIFACKLAFVPYLIVDRKMEAVEAVKASWRLTNGHALDIFLMFLLAIPIILAGLIALVVGVIPAAMWVTLSFASMYHSVSQTEKAPAQTAA